MSLWLKLKYLCLCLRLKIGLKIYGKLGPTITRIDPWTVVKVSYQLHESGAQTMRWVRQHTTIPIPKVRDFFRYDGMGYLQMEFIDGTTAHETWGPLSSIDRQRVIEELGGYIAQLRAFVPSTPQIVANIAGGSLLDHRAGEGRFGPFENHEAFHKFLRASMEPSECGPSYKPILAIHQRSYVSKLSHADLVPRNIILRGNRIAAIVDWENAGWYPEYWEYRKAHFASWARKEWLDTLPGILGQYEEESQADAKLYELIDDPQWSAKFVQSRREQGKKLYGPG